MAAEEVLLTQDQAAAYLGISKRSFQRLVADGKIPVLRLGYRTVRVRLVDVEEYTARTRGPDAELLVSMFEEILLPLREKVKGQNKEIKKYIAEMTRQNERQVELADRWEALADRICGGV